MTQKEVITFPKITWETRMFQCQCSLHGIFIGQLNLPRVVSGQLNFPGLVSGHFHLSWSGQFDFSWSGQWSVVSLL